MPGFRRRSRRSSSRSGGLRRGTDWSGASYGGVAQAGLLYTDWIIPPTISEQQLLEPAAQGHGQMREDHTLMRTLINAYVYSTLSQTEFFWFDVGIFVHKSYAPATSPDPLEVPVPADASEEWIWRRRWGFPKQIVATTTNFMQTENGLWIDVKSRRKLDANTGIAIVVDNGTDNETGNDVSFLFDFRMLFKKPR